jgi:ATP/maltotriose-dependent transcriptional regulator MalT
MERARWTDELLDERMVVIDERFERGFEEMRAMREDMHAGFAALRGEMAHVRGDLSAFQRQVTQILAGFAITLLGVVAAGVAAAITAAL